MIFIIGFIIAAILLTYSCCVVAGRADDAAQSMYEKENADD